MLLCTLMEILSYIVFFTLNKADDKKLIDDGGGNSAKLGKLLDN